MTERSSGEIDREVRRTRMELRDTLDEVHEALSPRRWVDERSEYLRHRGAGDMVVGFARVASEHPIPFALMLGGAVWLYLASSEGRRRNTEASGAAWPSPAASHLSPAGRGPVTRATSQAPLAVSPDA